MLRGLIILYFVSTRLFAQLNSSYDEQNPILTPDGKSLYFTIGNHPLNVSAKRDVGDIWVSQFQDGKWSAPTLAKGLINNGGYNAVLGFSADGSEMFLYGHYSASGEAAASQGISVSRKTSTGWSLPRNETVPYFQNKSIATGGYITPDKSIFIFSAESRDTYGNEDIYISFRNGDQWSEPKNLGTEINSSQQELSPWWSHDKKTIFFSTNHETAFGSFDVVSAERLDDTWQNWSPPKNLGKSINTPGKELFYHPFAEHIYFTSTHNSDGYGDIREIMMGNGEAVDTTIMAVTKPSTEDTGLIRIFGRVTNTLTNQGVAATITLHGTSIISTASNVEGSYEVNLNANAHYNIRVESEGFIGLFDKVDLSNQSVRKVEINFKLQPVAIGISINLRNVFFKQSSAELLVDSNDELEMVIEFLKTNPKVKIELSGHTDNAGKSSLNLKLSRDRVTRVKNYIVDKGVDARRITGVGYGESKPIASNKTEEGKKLNRRVEFKILSVD